MPQRLGALLALLISLSVGCAHHPPPSPVLPLSAKVTCATCPVPLNAKASHPLSPVHRGKHPHCTALTIAGFPVPDTQCTPGAVNPTVTLEVLKNPAFRTGCIRDCTTKSQQKATTYTWYRLPHPPNNQGQNQTCELDHVVPLEMGGADSLDNIWPQCGPDGAALPNRFFKEKDLVENYLTAEVKRGAMDLSTAQSGIAHDWTQFLDAARKNPVAPVGPVTENRTLFELFTWLRIPMPVDK